MGDSTRNSKRIAETEGIDSSITNFSKKMKLDFGFQESGLFSLNFKLQPHHCSTTSPEKFVSPATSSNSGGVLTGDFCSDDSPLSCCSSNDSSEVVRDNLSFSDLEAKSFETEHSMCIDNKFRETSPSSEFYGDTDDMDSSAQAEKKENSVRRQSPAEKMPSQSEVDEFFAVAEKEEQKRFAEKYNYDIVKDLPMEGRYQWVRLKP